MLGNPKVNLNLSPTQYRVKKWDLTLSLFFVGHGQINPTWNSSSRDRSPSWVRSCTLLDLPTWKVSQFYRHFCIYSPYYLQWSIYYRVDLRFSFYGKHFILFIFAHTQPPKSNSNLKYQSKCSKYVRKLFIDHAHYYIKIFKANHLIFKGK